jgi:hypothetical protein
MIAEYQIYPVVDMAEAAQALQGAWSSGTRSAEPTEQTQKRTNYPRAVRFCVSLENVGEEIRWLLVI